MRAGPAVSTTTRVPRNTASVMPWVTKTMVFFASLPDAQELEIHLLARERVERAERLVHQDELRIVDERARDRGALLHAAGELVGIFFLGTARDRRARAGRARGSRLAASGRPRISVGSITLSIMRRHFRSSGAGTPCRCRAPGLNGCAGEPMRTSPASCGVQAGEDFQQGGLAATRRADQRDKFAGFDVERRFGDREEFAAARAVDLLARRRDG